MKNKASNISSGHAGKALVALAQMLPHVAAISPGCNTAGK